MWIVKSRRSSWQKWLLQRLPILLRRPPLPIINFKLKKEKWSIYSQRPQTHIHTKIRICVSFLAVSRVHVKLLLLRWALEVWWTWNLKWQKCLSTRRLFLINFILTSDENPLQTNHSLKLLTFFLSIAFISIHLSAGGRVKVDHNYGPMSRAIIRIPDGTPITRWTNLDIDMISSETQMRQWTRIGRFWFFD